MRRIPASSTAAGWLRPSRAASSSTGYLTAGDLADHAGEWVEPIHATYRGYTIYETPPPARGWPRS